MNHGILLHIRGDKSYDLNFKSLGKFHNDNIFIENEKELIILEGLISNSDEILKKGESLVDLILKYIKSPTDVLNKFRGSFYFIHFDKIKKELFVSTDQWSSKFLYYSLLNDGGILISDSLDKIFNKRRELNNKNSLDQEGAYMLLTFGYMLDEFTLETNTKKIAPGTIISYNRENKFTENIWYRFPASNWEGNINENDIIEDIDFHFRKCTDRYFRKDKQYGFKHLVGLSGGLDSRMVSWVGNSLGHTEQTNFTFSQSNYLDEQLAKGMAEHLKHGWIFKALDHGLFLRDIESGVRIAGGNVSFMFTAHTNYFLSDIKFESFGNIHNGQNGEDTIGCPIANEAELDMNKYKYGIGYSTKYVEKIPSFERIVSNYANSELLWNYTRCINGSNVGLRSSQQFSEAATPFLDIDFNEFCFSIPMKYRTGHNLYKKWIIKKYPDAAKFEWEKNNKLITYKPIKFNFNGNDYDLKQIHKAILFKLGLIKPALDTKKHMNPINLWYKEDLKNTWDEYLTTNIDLLNDYRELKNDILNFYNTGSAINKSQCLTVLSAYKLYFS
ncbi:hypothetical protein [Ornithobacterium rhinotracheale]